MTILQFAGKYLYNINLSALCGLAVFCTLLEYSSGDFVIAMQRKLFIKHRHFNSKTWRHSGYFAFSYFSAFLNDYLYYSIGPQPSKLSEKKKIIMSKKKFELDKNIYCGCIANLTESFDNLLFTYMIMGNIPSPIFLLNIKCYITKGQIAYGFSRNRSVLMIPTNFIR